MRPRLVIGVAVNAGKGPLFSLDERVEMVKDEVAAIDDPKAGACHTLYQITDDARLNQRAGVIGSVLREECRALLQEFFALQRSRGKK